MSEAQAFFLLSVLCDKLLPGYYSTTMYGTLLDQKVFESLLEKTMPVLWDHLVKSDVQLSVVSLPWFLSLYINSMPLVFAFRVLDVFFLEGPKVLFQVGLAILRINGEELLDIQDDGSFISVLKSYFSRLDESAHPRSENPKLRAITRFQELMVVAFKEFSGITHSTITEQREKHKGAVLENIESFAKRTSIRNLGPESKRLSVDDLGTIYDRFYETLYQWQQHQKLMEEERKRQEKKKSERLSILAPPADREMGRVGLGPSPTHMDYGAFREFLAATAKWAVSDSPAPSRKESPGFNSQKGSSKSLLWANRRQPADHEFMQRLYRKWATDPEEGLSLQNVVNGLARLKGSPDIMNNINYFFNLYDDSGNGKVDREGILKMSEALLFLSRRGFEGRITVTQSLEDLNGPRDREHAEQNRLTADERFLGSVSAFIRRCFEYADPSHPENQRVAQQDSTTETAEKLGSFTIGDDEEDLIDVDGDKKSSTTEGPTKAAETTSEAIDGEQNRPRSESANPALDPNNPLHITLPTFRMVVLADELLEQFFESYFPQSFHLSDHPHPAALAASSSLSSNLTTFSNIGSARSSHLTAAGTVSVAGASGGIVPPGKGLRGVLDNIVTDGIRMAAEVKKRMDDAQRELERNALGREEEDDEEEDEDDYHGGAGASAAAMAGGIPSWGAGAYGADPEQRGVRETDRDLLEGAEVLSVRGKDESSSLLDGKENEDEGASSSVQARGEGASGHGHGHDPEVVSKVVEFES